MSRYFAGKVVPIITTFISGQTKIQENYFPEVFNIGFLLICGLGYWAIVWQVLLWWILPFVKIPNHLL
jgi:hypothetical protein